MIKNANRRTLATLIILLVMCGNCIADQIITASWYSVDSLKKEGSWAIWKGEMKNGTQFNDTDFTCASRLFALGTRLEVTNLENGKRVIVEVTDWIGERFAKTRIDLSKRAFSEIADLNRGIVEVNIKELL